MDLDKIGRWEGDKFVLNEPQVIDGKEVRTFDFSQMIDMSHGNITRHDIVEAMLDPHAQVEDYGEGLRGRELDDRGHVITHNDD